MRRAVLAAAAAGLACLLPAAAGVVAPVTQVEALVYHFAPSAVTVPSGGVLRFHSLEPPSLPFHHHIYDLDGPGYWGHLDSTRPCDPDAGELTSCLDVTLDQPAGSVVGYRCSLHAGMVGVVVVV